MLGRRQKNMTYNAAIAYACVAYRIMKYDGREQSEEHLDILLGVLNDFYTEKEIEKIYQQDIVFDSYEAVMDVEKIKQKTE